MLFIWGKRTYGASDKLGKVSIKTLFGHFWYLPLFPMTSYYHDAKSGRVFELNSLCWRSVLFGYLRVWGSVLAFFQLVAARNAEPEQALPSYIICAILAITIASSYLYDKKSQPQEVRQLRMAMNKNFGIALDPFECLDNLQQEIHALAQKHSPATLNEDWYKSVIHDQAADTYQLELAMLRARCDQHDQPLQQQVFRRLAQQNQ